MVKGARMTRRTPALDLDIVRKTLTVHRRDGRAVTIPFTLPHGTQLERIVLDRDRHEAVLGLPGGRTATVELRAEREQGDLLAGRTVVYLDQNQWGALSRWEHDEGRVEGGGRRSCSPACSRRRCRAGRASGIRWALRGDRAALW